MPTLRLTIGRDEASPRTLFLAQGDITRETADAIVNAANSSLLGGGGVDGAIHRNGGPAILEACKQLRQTQYVNGLPPGQAVATTAGRLPAKYVIHTVGPIWRGGAQGEPETLASAYHESVRVADKLQLSSIAFPAISTGAYGYPLEQAAEIAVHTTTQELAAGSHVRSIKLVVFDSGSFTVYAQQLEKFSASHPDCRLDRSTAE
jgi:O-acetyl-ADP-ribose deacetylase (regulator of RNase III)